MTEEDFAPIGKFLNTEDYHPILIPGPPAHLINIKSIKQHEEAALAAGGIWNHAKTLELTGRMHLIYRMIQTQWPFEPETLLMFTQLVYSDEDAGFREEARMKTLLKEEIAKRFFQLMLQNAVLLTRLMKANGDICERVGRRLAEDPEDVERVGLDD